MPLRFGTDGIRGVANDELTPELLLALGRAAARHLAGEAFLVGRDTRRSGPLLLAAFAAGVAAEGVDVVDLGVLPTPAIAHLAQRRREPAAVISASHNPFPDNGIKLLAAGGLKLSDPLERAVEAELDALFASRQPRGGPVGAGVGTIVTDADAGSQYLADLLASVDLGGRRFKVVLDCANGAASELAPRLFAQLDLDLTVLSASPNGVNINDQSGSTSPDTLIAAVLAEHADLGIGFDGDADRMIAIDAKGRLVDGDQLIVLFATDLDERGELEQRAVAVTVMSNLGLHRALEARGIAVVETPVGDRQVLDALEANSLVLGGEQSGHLIFAREATTGDGLRTALKLLELVAKRGRPLDELASQAMTRLPQVLRNVKVLERRRIGEAAALWAEVESVERELGPAGRVLVRASGTEEAVRVMIEAERLELAEELATRLAEVVVRELGSPTG